MCNDKAETRDALQLLVPADEAEPSFDRFHLPCLNLNLPGCGMSNSLRTNEICQPTSKSLFFPFSFSAMTKGFKRSPIHAAGDLLYRTLSCLNAPFAKSSLHMLERLATKYSTLTPDKWIRFFCFSFKIQNRFKRKS